MNTVLLVRALDVSPSFTEGWEEDVTSRVLISCYCRASMPRAAQEIVSPQEDGAGIPSGADFVSIVSRGRMRA